METGVFIRICRDGKWINLDIAECTMPELTDFLLGKSQTWLVSLIIHLLGKDGKDV